MSIVENKPITNMKNFTLSLLFCFFSIVSFGQNQRSEIEIAVENQITNVFEAFGGTIESVVIDELNFNPSEDFNIENVFKTSDELNDFIRIEVFYSTYEIRYTLISGGKEINRITNKY
jgi:hypothetical protein